MSNTPTRMQMQADSLGLTLEQYRELKILEIDLDEYKELLKKSDFETILTDNELQEFKELEIDFKEYLKKIRKTKKVSKKSSKNLTNEEKIGKLLGLEIKNQKGYEKFNLHIETETMEKLITVAETANMSVKEVINFILKKHLSDISVDSNLVLAYKERTTKKRKGSNK